MTAGIVMIYFDRPTQKELVLKLSGSLESGGYLFVGHAERLSGLDHGLEYVRPATYRKPLNKQGGSGKDYRSDGGLPCGRRPAVSTRHLCAWLVSQLDGLRSCGPHRRIAALHAAGLFTRSSR